MSAEIIDLAGWRVTEAAAAPVEWRFTMHGQAWEHLARAANHIEAGNCPRRKGRPDLRSGYSDE